ncbi:MAG: leucine-rich repeat domain-containing protein [Proteobacteria bacterium]|nr:leucine-rich repeat domain-containing protein [Pseudomonadota bacterium]NBP13882.1 leucine-rich repeat domain-containing protein [bacterium]
MNFLFYALFVFTITSQITALELLPAKTPDLIPLTFAAADVQEYLEQRGQDLQRPPNGSVPNLETAGQILKEVWGSQAIPDNYKTALCMVLKYGDCSYLDEVKEIENKPLAKALIEVLLRRYVNSNKISPEAISKFFFYHGLLGAKKPQGNLYIQNLSTFPQSCSFFHHFLSATIDREQVDAVLALLKKSNLSPQDYVDHSDLKPELERQAQEWLRRNQANQLSCCLPLNLYCLNGLNSLIPPQVTVLDLSNNHFENIGPNDFEGCNKLEKLILSNCGIKAIDIRFLDNLSCLKELELCGNPIARYDETQKEIQKQAERAMSLMERANPRIIFK